MNGPAAPAPRRRGLVAALAVSALLFVVACGLALYAFMLNVDLDEVKRRLSKEVEVRQQAERHLAETRNLLTASRREVEQLRQQLAYKETDYQAAISAKPALPVVVNFRESILGRGLVAVLQNTSDRYLTVVLSVRNPTLSTVKRFKLDLEPQSSADFGHFEGWRFASGDEVAIFNDEFAAIRLTVP
ncbi:MAG: hypothetical protein AB1593_07160 [Pseudomonadota bacterium]